MEHHVHRGRIKKRSTILSNASPIGQNSAAKNQDSELDSSDDEGAAPALSAAAEELLGGRMEKGASMGSEAGITRKPTLYNARGSVTRGLDISTEGSPQKPLHTGSPRVVKIKRNSPVVSNHLRRTLSTSSVGFGSPVQTKSASDLKTPGPRPRSALGASAMSSTSGNSSARYVSGGSVGLFAGVTSSGDDIHINITQEGQDHPSVNTNSTRSKADENGPQNSLRVKRVGKVQGRFLSGPARRGVIRRHSEEEQSPIQRNGSGSPNQMVAFPGEQNLASTVKSRTNEKIGAPIESGNLQQASGIEALSVPLNSPKNNKSYPDERQEGCRLTSQLNVANRCSTTADAAQVPYSRVSQQKLTEPFRVPPLPPLPSLQDQENDPPPTFKRNKISSSVLGQVRLEGQDGSLSRGTPGAQSPLRKPLAPRNQNTPRRQAPPPPKMSMLETATATAGAASTTQRRLKRQYISINGKMLTKMECIGRGGSGRVYRVMAENFKHFALKRVSLEDVDQAAIRGFKGEIDLLKKLENVDRVIRLYDFEINEEKRTLSVLMDLGELDLKKILDPRLDEESGKFDATFTRYIWKEMLECVEAIHAHDIVHSDLKPANFVSVQGRLKLIDFGIANTIQDNTVNVHREQQIGTPNYMAPEALLDINAAAGRKSILGKLMKLGKPSDVWSLACILYQIVYGKPPFGHIPNQMNKVIAITDQSHVIVFPELGLGKTPVPYGLIRTLKRCLNRDPALRPTIADLLGDKDPFLHPDTPGSINITPEHVKAIQHSILKIIEAHGLPEANGKSKEAAVRQWLDQWGPQLFTGMKHSLERGSI